MATDHTNDRIGWIGTGRMGFPMAERLAKAGCTVSAWNRTRTKAEPLTKSGVTVVAKPSDLADCDIVFCMVAAGKDLKQVTIGHDGVLAGHGKKPRILVDCSTVDEDASAEVPVHAEKLGVAMLASPVSGNGKVAKAGRLTLMVSGPEDAYEAAQPYLERLSAGVTYVGAGELARLVKICHNVFLGVVIQSLVEVTSLAEKGGVTRHAFLDVINKSVMGSMFTRYKTPALVNLDFTPTFTPVLLRKDLELGLDAGRKSNTPLPVTALTREIIQNLIGLGFKDVDFATLLVQQARNAGYNVKAENVTVSDGLS